MPLLSNKAAQHVGCCSGTQQRWISTPPFFYFSFIVRLQRWRENPPQSTRLSGFNAQDLVHVRWHIKAVGTFCTVFLNERPHLVWSWQDLSFLWNVKWPEKIKVWILLYEELQSKPEKAVLTTWQKQRCSLLAWQCGTLTSSKRQQDKAVKVQSSQQRQHGLQRLSLWQISISGSSKASGL